MRDFIGFWLQAACWRRTPTRAGWHNISGYFFGVKTVETVLARFALDSPRFKPWAVEKTVLGMVLAI
jgi:hypothetical protein